VQIQLMLVNEATERSKIPHKTIIAQSVSLRVPNC